MSIMYDGSHSITFVNERVSPVKSYNSWSDLRMIPTTPPSIKIYEPSLTIVSPPGTDYVIDLSEARTGRIMKGRCVGDWEFVLDSERYGHKPYTHFHHIEEILHGKWLTVKLDDRPSGESYYSGRIWIKSFKIGANYSDIGLSYNLGVKGQAYISKGV